MITHDMGHSKVPYPKSWEYLDACGKRAWESKQRIRSRVERQEKREMEMIVMGDGMAAGAGAGGPMPSGYYG